MATTGTTQKVANRITVEALPKGYLKLAGIRAKIASLKKSGKAVPAVNRVVTAIGRDCGYKSPLHPICTPVYFMGARYVHPWLFTEQGLKAISSGDFSKAPKGPYGHEVAQVETPKTEEVQA